MTAQRVAIIAVGERADGADSRAGSAVAELVDGIRALPSARGWRVTLVEDTQFQLEHALHLQGLEADDIALFVDCRNDVPAPYAFSEVEMPETHRILSPADTLTAADVLHTLATLARRESLPAAFSLTVQQDSTERKQGLSADAASGHSRALTLVEELLGEPAAHSWRGKVTG